MIPEPGDANREVTVTETFHVQTDDELSEKELKQIEADDQVIQTILPCLPEDIYAAEKKAKLFNEWEMFTSNEGESIESYYHHFLKLMNDLKRNKHFPKKIASNLKFLNNLQPEWCRHVTIVHQTKDLHTADYTQLYDFLKYNQKEVNELKAERLAKTQDPLALMVNSNNPYAFPAPHQDLSSFNQNYLQQPMPNPEDITDPTTAMNMTLTLMAKAFKLNYSTPANNNQRISSNPRNGNQNQIRNGNLVAARAKGNAAGQNRNQISSTSAKLHHRLINLTTLRAIGHEKKRQRVRHKFPGMHINFDRYALVPSSLKVRPWTSLPNKHPCLSFHITIAMSTQQDIYAAGSESRPPMLNKENYVSWSSRLLRYAKSRPNGKLIHNSILNGPYVRKMIHAGDANREITVIETFHLQTDDELSDKELKQIEAGDQAIQTILLGLPEDIYAGMNMGQDRQMQMVGGNSRNQFRQYAGQNAGNLVGYNDVIENQIGNGNLVAARAERNAVEQNGNQIRCYNCRGKEEAVIQLQTKEYDLMAAGAHLDEIEEVNANCILMDNMQQASTSGTQTDRAPVYDSDGSAEVHENYDENCDDNEIFNMFTQEEQYTELFEPIPESHQVPQNDNDIISKDTSVEQGGK
nr:hypothetical protein [Tanacetum cinerariifolium]